MYRDPGGFIAARYGYLIEYTYIIEEKLLEKSSFLLLSFYYQVCEKFSYELPAHEKMAQSTSFA